VQHLLVWSHPLKKILYTLPLTAVFVGTLGFAHAAEAVSAADRAFIAKVSQGGMQDIKDQGATEAHDHDLVGAKLTSIANSAGVQFPTTLNAQFQKELDDLTALSGTAFDAAYLKDMEDIHAKDGAAFAKEAAGGTNPDLRSFAAETHRIVVRHIGELKALGPAK
jgi:putative membrane protein